MCIVMVLQEIQLYKYLKYNYNDVVISMRIIYIYVYVLDIIVYITYRSKTHREKLPATVAELSPPRRTTGKYHAGGATYHHGTSC